MVKIECPNVVHNVDTKDEISKDEEEEIRKELAKLGYLD